MGGPGDGDVEEPLLQFQPAAVGANSARDRLVAGVQDKDHGPGPSLGGVDGAECDSSLSLVLPARVESRGPEVKDPAQVDPPALAPPLGGGSAEFQQMGHVDVSGFHAPLSLGLVNCTLEKYAQVDQAFKLPR